MTTLTQSDLDDIRRTQLLRKEHAKQSSMDYAEGVQCLIDCDTLLSHIAKLTAERDEAIADNDDCHIEIAGKDARIAALEAQLAERDARISVLEVAAVKAVLPLEAMNISGVAKRFDEETTLAILDGISSVRAAIRARSEQEGK